MLVAAKDRYGIKPLFWTIVDGRLLVSSEAKGCLALGWKPEWDVGSIKDGEWNYDSRTLLKGVNKVNSLREFDGMGELTGIGQSWMLFDVHA